MLGNGFRGAIGAIHLEVLNSFSLAGSLANGYTSYRLVGAVVIRGGSTLATGTPWQLKALQFRRSNSG